MKAELEKRPKSTYKEAYVDELLLKLLDPEVRLTLPEREDVPEEIMKLVEHWEAIPEEERGFLVEKDNFGNNLLESVGLTLE